MPTSEAKFDEAISIIQNMPKDGPVKPTSDDKLHFYKYFKQATIGDVNTSRPTGLLDFEGKAKWDAWKSVEGTSKQQSWEKYVNRLVDMLKKVENEDTKKWMAQLDYLS